MVSYRFWYLRPKPSRCAWSRLLSRVSPHTPRQKVEELTAIRAQWRITVGQWWFPAPDGQLREQSSAWDITGDGTDTADLSDENQTE
jgi:hypothetical protein